MSPLVRNLVLLAAALAVVTASLWAVQEHQRGTVDRAFADTAAVQQMLTGMIDQETALRGFLQTGRESFLEPYGVGRDRVERGTRHMRTGRRERQDLALLERAELLARTWQREADQEIASTRLAGRSRASLADAVRRKEVMDGFRGTIARLAARVEDERRRAFDADQRLSVGLVVALALLFGGLGWLLLGRPAARQTHARRLDHRRRDLQSEFARTIQLMDSEDETHDLVRRHLERTMSADRVVVLQRNNSADRLIARTELATEHPLAVRLVDATPRSCLAVRLGASHEKRDGQLLECDLCGAVGTDRTLCTPLVVSGEVIGSVLVGHDAPMEEPCRQVIEDTVTQVAPVIANMRNLAIAEERASTDALTGLANRRAAQDTIRRMVAHAQRTATSLAFVAIDVDHFKRINDRFGHDRGDEVLAAVAQALAGALRVSDFVSRHGGEEFVALLPDTDLPGALTAAENLRVAVETLDVLGTERVTASFGVAVLPEDGTDGATLMRQADRALYAAKANGRNRVETAAAGTPLTT